MSAGRGRRLLPALPLLLVLVLLLLRARFLPVRQEGEGMRPALQDGQLVLVERGAPARPGQIVLVRLRSGEARYLKRLIATEGEELRGGPEGLEVDGRSLVVDPAPGADPCTGEPLWAEGRGEARWWASGLRAALPSTRLLPGQRFVIGDARAQSRDSRTWGPVEEAEIEGVVRWILPMATSCEGVVAPPAVPPVVPKEPLSQ